MLIAAYALVGLLAGRVLALLAARIPTDTPLPYFKSANACENCQTPRPVWTLLPLVGTLYAGQCPTCGMGVGRRRLAIEIVTAVVFALIAWRFPAERAPVYAVYAAVLILIAAIDLEHRLIFDIVMLPAIFVVGPLGGWLTGISPLSMALGAAMWAGFLLLSKWITRPFLGADALGTGDIYLAVFLGTICGAKATGAPLGILSYALLSGVGSMLLLALRLRSARDPIPFAPFLILGAAVALWQQGGD